MSVNKLTKFISKENHENRKKRKTNNMKEIKKRQQNIM